MWRFATFLYCSKINLTNTNNDFLKLIFSKLEKQKTIFVVFGDLPVTESAKRIAFVLIRLSWVIFQEEKNENNNWLRSKVQQQQQQQKQQQQQLSPLVLHSRKAWREYH